MNLTLCEGHAAIWYEHAILIHLFKSLLLEVHRLEKSTCRPLAEGDNY